MENVANMPHTAAQVPGPSPAVRPQNVPTVALSRRGVSLRARLAVLVAVLVALVVGIGSFLLLRVFESRVERDLFDTAAVIARAVADDIELRPDRPVPAGLRQYLLPYADLPPVLGATVLVAEGGRDWTASTGAIPVPAEVELARQAFGRGAEIRRAEPARVMVAVPVTHGGIRIGGATVSVSADAVAQTRQRTRSVTFWFALLAVVILTLLVDVLARPLILRPIRHILDVMRRAGRGDLEARADIHRPDELGAIAEGLNDMLEQTQRLNASLQDRVEEATASLRARNDELIESYQRMFALREALARAQQAAAATQTAASLAHQIGTPLNLISGYVQMMIEEEAEPRLQERLYGVEDQISKLTGFVKATLDSVRQTSAAREPVFPSAVLRRIAEVARPRLFASRIDLRLEVDDGLPWLMGDAVQLELALLNLVNNAVDAMPDGGTLWIRGIRRDTTARIEVTDTGTGIAPELVPRVFDAWVTTKPVGKGTGLGLNIAKEVVAAHGGTMAVTSEPGRGTTFTIELPCRPEPPAIREV
jgi:two-component system, NtrC family, sensor kinase